MYSSTADTQVNTEFAMVLQRYQLPATLAKTIFIRKKHLQSVIPVAANLFLIGVVCLCSYSEKHAIVRYDNEVHFPKF